MKFNTLITACAASLMVGCAGPSYMATPVSVDTDDVNTVCVVNNNDLPISIQGQINSYIASRGYESMPISGPGVSAELGCNVYVVYGGVVEWDIGDFLHELRITVYTPDHMQVGYAEGKVPNNLNLSKWSNGDKLVAETVSQIF